MRRAWLLFAVVAAITFCLGPFVWQLLTSLRPESELTSTGLPSSISFESYAGAFHGRPFGRVLLNSFVVAGTTTVFCIAVGASAAFALAKLQFRGKSVLLGGALAVSMFPPIATVSPLFLVIRALGLRDELAGLVLPYTTFALPMTLWILTGFFATSRTSCTARPASTGALRSRRSGGCSSRSPRRASPRRPSSCSSSHTTSSSMR